MYFRSNLVKSANFFNDLHLQTSNWQLPNVNCNFSSGWTSFDPQTFDPQTFDLWYLTPRKIMTFDPWDTWPQTPDPWDKWPPMTSDPQWHLTPSDTWPPDVWPQVTFDPQTFDPQWHLNPRPMTPGHQIHTFFLIGPTVQPIPRSVQQHGHWLQLDSQWLTPWLSQWHRRD